MKLGLDVAIHKTDNKLELLFSEKPPIDLSDYLQTLGFRLKRLDHKQYFVVDHPSYVFFSEALKEALQKGNPYMDIPIRAAYAPIEDNIDHDKFSYVTITYLDGKQTRVENFVLFDNFKKIAHAIVKQHAKNQKGLALQSISVTPRKYKAKARKLLWSGRVLGASNKKEDILPVLSKIKGSVNPITPTNLESLKDKHEATSTNVKTDLKSTKTISSSPSSKAVEKESSPKQELKARPPQAMDMVMDDHIVPFVLIPYGVIAPFDHVNVNTIRGQDIELAAPYLKDIKDLGLSKVSAKVLFELSQMPHPKDYDIPVSRAALLQEWEKRGEFVFKELAYPTDMDYPYVNIHVGYQSVSPLGQLLGGNSKKQWWAVVEHSRPISHLKKALVHIGREMDKIEEKRLVHFNEKTGKPKTKKEDKEQYWSYTYTLENFIASRAVIQNYLKEKGSSLQEPPLKEEKTDKVPSKKDITQDTEQAVLESGREPSAIKVVETKSKGEGDSIPDKTDKEEVKETKVVAPTAPEKEIKDKPNQKVSTQKKETSHSDAILLENTPDQIREKLKEAGFRIPFTGRDVFKKKLQCLTISLREAFINSQYKEKLLQPPFTKLAEQRVELEVLLKKGSKLESTQKQELQTSIANLESHKRYLKELIDREQAFFKEELFQELLLRTGLSKYELPQEKESHFRQTLLPKLLSQDKVFGYKDISIGKMFPILLEDYFLALQPDTNKPIEKSDSYLDQLIAIMHDHYIAGERLGKKKIEAIGYRLGIPSKGQLWEAVELSWLLWYKMLYKGSGSFSSRLQEILSFWNKIQPTYNYSDSSKELYKQYSTPCPIGAMVAEYTGMQHASSIFEPSAGNGLLVLGADPQRTHVNEIDSSRRVSLNFQKFKKITHLNAALPFPKEMTRSFDVVVTNPPFASWQETKANKEWIAKTYFQGYRGIAQHIRLEHLMCGLALHTLKDSGRAALIIMGHLYFDSDGYIAKYRPFFNWLYSNYRVDDVINLNGFKLYNRQGAVVQSMLILLRGRKQIPSGVAPRKVDQTGLDAVVDSFEGLWKRISSHLPELSILEQADPPFQNGSRAITNNYLPITIRIRTMIYYNSQLMETPLKATLYMVSNPTAFTRYEDHDAAIYFRLHQLIEGAMQSGEDPISLIEDYLQTMYTDGKTVEQITSFLYHNDKMQLALWTLKDSWSMLDPTLPSSSLLYGGMGKEQTLQLYAEITLRTFLEALAANK